MSVGDFLLKRLAELGARYLFGVPGDTTVLHDKFLRPTAGDCQGSVLQFSKINLVRVVAVANLPQS